MSRSDPAFGMSDSRSELVCLGRRIMDSAVDRSPATFREISLSGSCSPGDANFSGSLSLVPQFAGVNAFEIAAFDPLERVQFVVGPTIVRGTRDEPVAAVVG